MNIKVKRYGHGKDSTGGLLSVNGTHFCYVCEDQEQAVKVMHETRIPNGYYEVKLRDAGGMNEKYKKKFKFHRGMLHLQNVPGFEWVYIHIGNTDDHTSGCLLVGYGTTVKDGEYTVSQSTQAYSDLYELILFAMNLGERIYVEII